MGEEKDPLDAAIANIEAKIEKKFTDQESHFADLGRNIAAEVKAIVAPPEKKKSWADEDGDDETYVTKGVLRSVIREAITEVKNETRDVAKSVVTEHSNKTSADVQALRDHPEINTPAMLKEVEAELVARVNAGKDPNDKFLFSDSVVAVYSRAVRQGRIVPKHLAQRQNEMDAADEDNFEGNPGSGPRGDEPTARQIAIARKMGMSEERFRQIRKNKGQTH